MNFDDAYCTARSCHIWYHPSFPPDDNIFTKLVPQWHFHTHVLSIYLLPNACFSTDSNS